MKLSRTLLCGSISNKGNMVVDPALLNAKQDCLDLQQSLKLNKQSLTRVTNTIDMILKNNKQHLTYLTNIINEADERLTCIAETIEETCQQYLHHLRSRTWSIGPLQQQKILLVSQLLNEATKLKEELQIPNGSTDNKNYEASWKIFTKISDIKRDDDFLTTHRNNICIRFIIDCWLALIAFIRKALHLHQAQGHTAKYECRTSSNEAEFEQDLADYLSLYYREAILIQANQSRINLLQQQMNLIQKQEEDEVFDSLLNHDNGSATTILTH